MFVFRYGNKAKPFRIRELADIEKGFRPGCSLVLVTPDSGEIGGEDDYVRLHRFDRSADAAAARDVVVDAIRKYRAGIYLTGDCWHFAMALRRLYGDRGLEIIALRRPDQINVDHVAGRFPDGTIVDALGAFADAAAHAEAAEEFYIVWRRGVKLDAWLPAEPIEVSKIVGILDAAHEEDGPAEKVAWNDPAQYAFAGETEDFIRICYAEEIERMLARPRMMMRMG